MVDRADIRVAAYITSLSMIACILTLLGLCTSGFPGPIMMIFISLALGTVAAAHHPVRLSPGPRLVPPSDVSGVVALSAINFNVARLFSPAIDGLMFERLGITPAILITGTMFLPNLAIIARLHPRRLADRTTRTFATAIREWLIYVRTRRTIVTILAATCIFPYPFAVCRRFCRSSRTVPLPVVPQDSGSWALL